MLTIDEIKHAVTKVGKKYGIKNAYLFGSYAKGKANDSSDVDIIMDRGKLRTYDNYYHMHKELEQTLGTEVDLLATDGINPRFYKLIENDRILLYGA